MRQKVSWHNTCPFINIRNIYVVKARYVLDKKTNFGVILFITFCL